MPGIMVKINKMVIVLVLFIIGLAAFFSFNYLSDETVKVKTAEASLGEITQSISYAGSIDSPRRVKVGSKIAGRVVAVLFDELDEVHAGQVLIKLEDAELKAQLSEAAELCGKLAETAAEKGQILREVLANVEHRMQAQAAHERRVKAEENEDEAVCATAG